MSRQTYELEIMATVNIIATVRTSWPPQPAPPASSLWERFSYFGSVLTPASPDAQTFAFIFNRFCYDPTDDTFLLGTHETQRPREVARLSIPAPVPHAQDGTVAGLPTCSLVAGPADITDGQATTYAGGARTMEVGGIVVHNGKIYWAQEGVYDTDGFSHPVVGSSTNTGDLTNLQATAPVEVDIHYKEVSRCITVIGETWANAHVGGKRLLMGCMGISGDTLASHGPVAIAVAEPPGPTLATERLSFYPYQGPRPFVWADNGHTYHQSQHQYSLQWIEDGADNWIVMTGRRTLGQYTYTGSTPCESGNGFKGFPYVPYLMIYHADDFLPVLAGTKEPDEIRPREVVDLSVHFVRQEDSCLYRHRHATAWDAVRKRLWVIEPRGDDQPFDDRAVLHAFDLGA